MSSKWALNSDFYHIYICNFLACLFFFLIFVKLLFQKVTNERWCSTDGRGAQCCMWSVYTAFLLCLHQKSLKEAILCISGVGLRHLYVRHICYRSTTRGAPFSYRKQCPWSGRSHSSVGKGDHFLKKNDSNWSSISVSLRVLNASKYIIWGKWLQYGVCSLRPVSLRIAKQCKSAFYDGIWGNK